MEPINIDIVQAVKDCTFSLVNRAVAIKPESVNNIESTWKKRCCLHIASENNSEDICQALLTAQGLDVNKLDKSGKSALMEARTAKIVKLILSHKSVEINLASEIRFTALMNHSMEGRTECVKSLLEAGAEVNLENTYGYSALQFSYQFCHNDCMKLLLAYGADTSGWIEWEFFDFGEEEQKAQAKSIMIRRRSFLLEWSIFTHRFYPEEFEELALTCMAVWNRLDVMFKNRIPRDIKRHLIKYVAKNWRLQVVGPLNNVWNF